MVAAMKSWSRKVFFVALSGPPWTKRCCRCRSSWSFVALSGPERPFVDKKMLPLPFFVVLRGP